MDKNKIGQHISQQYNEELEDIRNRVLSMGGMVEQQIRDAVASFVNGDIELSDQVIRNDININAMEVSLDEECSQVLARRQPAASDLRLIIAVIKTITDLERIGDQAEKVAHLGQRLAEEDRPKSGYSEIQVMGRLVSEMLHDTLDAFARMDEEAALKVAMQDKLVDHEYEGVMRQRITFMMEDPRSIARSLDVMWAARALERIGDHARNISEYIIYLVRGKDVRHTSLEQIEEVISSGESH